MLGFDGQRRNGLLGSIHWTFGKSSKVLNADADEGSRRISDHSLAKVLLDARENVGNRSCSICGSTSELQDTSCHQLEEGSSGVGSNENSLAIVPVQTTELKPGWPLLHRKISSDRRLHDKPFMPCHQISVVQWAMRLPRRNILYGVDNDKQPSICDQGQDQSVALDSESGALVPVDSEIWKTSSSPECNTKSIPKELESLHVKYSSTCRLFEYQELVLATSNFLPGLFPSTSLAVFNFNKTILFLTTLLQI